MGKLVPIVGKYYMLGNHVYMVVDVGAKTFSYSYVNSATFKSSEIFTWDLSVFREVEVTDLTAALL